MFEMLLWMKYFVFSSVSVTIVILIFLSWKAFHFLILQAGVIPHSSPCTGTWGMCVCTESFQQWRTRRQWFGNGIFCSVMAWDAIITMFGGMIPAFYWIVITSTLFFVYLLFAVWSNGKKARFIKEVR